MAKAEPSNIRTLTPKKVKTRQVSWRLPRVLLPAVKLIKHKLLIKNRHLLRRRRSSNQPKVEYHSKVYTAIRPVRREPFINPKRLTSLLRPKSKSFRSRAPRPFTFSRRRVTPSNLPPISSNRKSFVSKSSSRRFNLNSSNNSRNYNSTCSITKSNTTIIKK